MRSPPCRNCFLDFVFHIAIICIVAPCVCLFAKGYERGQEEILLLSKATSTELEGDQGFISGSKWTEGCRLFNLVVFMEIGKCVAN